VSAAGNTITVNSTSDVTNNADGLCTLREALIAANTNTASGAVAGECAAGSSDGSDTIDLTGLTASITLTSALPNISSDMTLNGPGPGTLSIRRSNTFTIFTVSSSATATISGLAVQGGGPDPIYPGIVNSDNGTLNLTNCAVSGFGLGISNGSERTLTISNCVVSGNSSRGGISNFQGTVNLFNSVVSGNQSSEHGHQRGYAVSSVFRCRRYQYDHVYKRHL
jgi:CSLREA domain-containing protein